LPGELEARLGPTDMNNVEVIHTGHPGFDLVRLDRWFDRVLTADTAAEVFAD
jgi:hypothetical protein